MRTITGALLLLGAEQAYAHANLIQFPNQVEARSVLLPASMALLGLGALTLIWGLWTDRPKGNCTRNNSVPTPSKSE